MTEHRYKFIYFAENANKGKTRHFHCCNTFSHEIIGIVKWYSPFRSYSFFPSHDTVFSIGCLRDILDFIKKLDKERQGV